MNWQSKKLINTKTRKKEKTRIRSVSEYEMSQEHLS